jgi:hypothetical protein
MISTGVDYAGIREYTEGGEYQRVEWKATARLRKLMVKQFHSETRTNLQMLIDTGRTMQEQSYAGTRLDEALAVAQLLMQAAVELEKSVGLYFYDEKELVKSLKPSAGEEQLDALHELASKWSWRVWMMAQKRKGVDGATWFSNSPRLARYALSQGAQVSAYFRLLKRMLGKGYRNTGIYKAIREAAMNTNSILVILTDLESNIDALLEAVSTHQEHGLKIIVAQIGATWRLSPNLETAYANHQRNSNTLMRLRANALTVIDVSPDQLLEMIFNYLSKSFTVIRSGTL